MTSVLQEMLLQVAPAYGKRWILRRIAVGRCCHSCATALFSLRDSFLI